MEHKGKWIKYEAYPKDKDMANKTFKKLCDDVGNFEALGWPRSEFSLEYFGDGYLGQVLEHDFYLYYELDKETGKKNFKMFFSAYRGIGSDKDYHLDCIGGIKGKNSTITEKYTYEVPLDLLPELLNKLHQVWEWKTPELEHRLRSYEELKEVAKNGIKSGADILIIYKNIGRKDTDLASNLVKNRCLQDDFNHLAEDNKVKLLSILDEYKISWIKQLQGIKKEEKALVVTDIEVLKKTLSKEATNFVDVSDNGLYCLNFVPDTILSNKELLLDIFSEYYMKLKISYQFRLYDMIPKEILIDPQFLKTITKVSPYELYNIIIDFKGNDRLKKLMEEKRNDKKYVIALLDAYFRNILANKKYVRQRFIPFDVLEHFPLYDNLEKEILMGPEPNAQREEMKEKIGDSIKLTRNKRRANKYY